MQDLDSFELNLLWAVLASAVLGIAYAFFLRNRLLAQDKGTARMQELLEFITSGTTAYLSRQRRTIMTLAVVLAAIAGASVYAIPPDADATERFGDLVLPWVAGGRAVGVLAGAIFAYAACALGMRVAAEGNVRVAAASRRGYSPALQTAYRAANVTGMLVAGLGVLGSALIIALFGTAATYIILSFALGSAMVALVLRVAGGIYSQSASMGAELVRKVDLSVQEDDPNNTAVVADMVGDNAGDNTGIAADLFESQELTFAAALILGLVFGAIANVAAGQDGIDMRFVLFPLLVRGIGLLASLIGNGIVRTDERRRNAAGALNRGFYLTALLTVAGVAGLTYYYMLEPANDLIGWRPFIAVTIGVVLAIVLKRLTLFFTAPNYGRVKGIGSFSRTGSTPNVLSGLSVGFESSLWTIVAIAAALMGSVVLYADVDPEVRLTAVLYSISLTSLGLLSLGGSLLAMNGFGVIADTAGRIGRLAGIDKNARNAMEDMDAVGNTLRATTRVIAIGATLTTAVALFGAFYISTTSVQAEVNPPILIGINLASPAVLVGLLLGGAVPLLAASLLIQAILRAAADLVTAARRQLKASGRREERPAPNYGATVEAATAAAQQELMSLGVIAVLLPVVVGFGLGAEALGAFLIGLLLSGHLMAIFQTNMGGAWGNARRYIEDGFYGGKHSEAHKAALITDAVGRTLRTVTGPALNPLVKISGLTTLLIGPALVALRPADQPISPTLWGVIGVGLVVILWAIRQSHRETQQMAELSKAAAAQSRI